MYAEVNPQCKDDEEERREEVGVMYRSSAGK